MWSVSIKFLSRVFTFSSSFSHCYAIHVPSHLSFFTCFVIFVSKLRGMQQEQALINSFPSAVVVCVYFSIASAPGLKENLLSPRQLIFNGPCGRKQ